MRQTLSISLRYFAIVTSAVIFSSIVATSYAQSGHKSAPSKRGHGATLHNKIDAARATKVALHRYPGKVVGRVSLENEDGKWQYSVNVRSGRKLREIMVDSHTGKIASVEVTSKKEEASEAASEEHHQGKG